MIPHLRPDHEALRDSARRFVSQAIEPFADAWDEAEEFPRTLYRKAAEAGLLGIGFPEEYGGCGGDIFHRLVLTEELCRAGSGGVLAGLFSVGIALPPILALGSEEQKRRIAPPLLSGEYIGALAVTEPSGGSDVANLKTTARRASDGSGDWLLTGQKTFITSGMRADLITVAARTGGPGMGGISLFAVPGNAPGLSRSPLRKMGWWASDTATLYFDDCRVSADALIGQENAAFFGLMHNFNGERLGLAAAAVGFAQVCVEESIAYAKSRETFGKPLMRRQVIQHKLVDMQTELLAAKAMLWQVAARVQAGESPVPELCMTKNFCTAALERIAGEAVQIHGGAGYLRGSKVERIFRETKVLSIGGGASEIMRDLAARQQGW